jgi:hypothetical protein
MDVKGIGSYRCATAHMLSIISELKLFDGNASGNFTASHIIVMRGYCSCGLDAKLINFLRF